MPLTVDPRAKTSPGSIACPGGDIEMTFRAQSAQPELQAQYVIANQDPYKWTASANGTISGNGKVVTIVHQVKTAKDKFGSYRSGQLVVARAGKPCPGDEAALPLRIEVREKKGSRIGATMRPASDRVAILSGAVEAMRTEKGLTQADLADRTGLHVSTISRAETGKAVSDKTRELLEKHL